MKQLLVFLFLLCSMSVSAQDVIVKKDGSTVVCRVVEVTATEITYKRWSDLNGSNYVMDKSLASGINYESGRKDTFSETESLYMPNNQNDGTHAMNDNALLRLDFAASKPYNKVKNLRMIGWIGGGVLAAAGIVCASIWSDSEDLGPSIALIGGGAVFTGTFLLLANNQKKKIQRFESSSVLKYDFDFGNGSTLSAGIDMLGDRAIGNNTLGIGLRYNF